KYTKIGRRRRRLTAETAKRAEPTRATCGRHWPAAQRWRQRRRNHKRSIAVVSELRRRWRRRGPRAGGRTLSLFRVFRSACDLRPAWPAAQRWRQRRRNHKRSIAVVCVAAPSASSRPAGGPVARSVFFVSFVDLRVFVVKGWSLRAL